MTPHHNDDIHNRTSKCNMKNFIILDTKRVQKAQNHWTAHNTTLYNIAGAQTTYENNQIFGREVFQPTTKKTFYS